MSDALNQRLLEALLDSWDRNNTILLNLLRALPVGGLAPCADAPVRCRSVSRVAAGEEARTRQERER